MYIDYPRCPECQCPLLRCKRYSRLIKKIHNKIGTGHVSRKDLSDSLKNDATIKLHLLTASTQLPEHIEKIIRKNLDNNRQNIFGTLFVHALNLFTELDNNVSDERSKMLTTIYEHIKKSDSLFLTRQQWS
ncbi:unnamed protein product, partial [Rotaria magnacalcarata]